MTRERPVALTVAAGAALGLAFTLTPLTVLVLAAFAILLQRFATTLPSRERWWFVRLFVVAMVIRVASIALLFVVAQKDIQGSAILFGDEAYSLARSWRIRNVVLGIPQLKYDYTVAFEGYGRTNYLSMMTFLELLAGPSPYGLRVLNAALFLVAVQLMFRITRHAFGPMTAFAGSVVLVFLPTLFFWSISLLKEPFYFVLTVGVLASVLELVRAPAWPQRLAWGVIIAVELFTLRDLRVGAVALTVSGLALGGAIAWTLGRPRRLAVGAAALVLAVAAVMTVQPLQQRATALVSRSANVSTGHVFTVGHGYKLLDEEFYVTPRAKSAYDLTPAEAARYAVRAAITYVAMPLPWQMETRGELTYLPEQMFWYVTLLLAPIGFVAAQRRDRTLAALLIAYVLPTAVIVAATTGNVGTLIRHRTLIIPYLVWVSVVGFMEVIGHVRARAEPAR